MEVRIKIKSTVTDLTLAEKYKSTLKGGFFTAEDGTVLPYEKMNEECEQVISYTVLGEYREENGRVTVSYTEPEDVGLECVTSLIFDKNDRSSLTMIRTGELNAAFRFDMNERRQLCSYETPFMPVEFTVNTKKVGNNISEEKGGAIVLDYCLEVRGINTERNRMFIEVRPT